MKRTEMKRNGNTRRAVIVCKFALDGKCKRGSDCPYHHPEGSLEYCNALRQQMCDKKTTTMCHYGTQCSHGLNGSCRYVCPTEANTALDAAAKADKTHLEESDDVFGDVFGELPRSPWDMKGEDFDEQSVKNSPRCTGSPSGSESSPVEPYQPGTIPDWDKAMRNKKLGVYKKPIDLIAAHYDRVCAKVVLMLNLDDDRKVLIEYLTLMYLVMNKDDNIFDQYLDTIKDEDIGFRLADVDIAYCRATFDVWTEYYPDMYSCLDDSLLQWIDIAPWVRLACAMNGAIIG